MRALPKWLALSGTQGGRSFKSSCQGNEAKSSSLGGLEAFSVKNALRLGVVLIAALGGCSSGDSMRAPVPTIGDQSSDATGWGSGGGSINVVAPPGSFVRQNKDGSIEVVSKEKQAIAGDVDPCKSGSTFDKTACPKPPTAVVPPVTPTPPSNVTPVNPVAPKPPSNVPPFVPGPPATVSPPDPGGVVQTVVLKTCAKSGCHSSVPGPGLKSYTSQQGFNNECPKVITQLAIPRGQPGYMPPEGSTITAAERNALTTYCRGVKGK